MCSSHRPLPHASAGGAAPNAGSPFLRVWVLFWSSASALLALLWLLLRSGTKPSRLAYPCQQAAMSTAAAAFGVPVVAAVLACRARVIAWLRTWAGRSVLAGVAVAAIGVIAQALVPPGAVQTRPTPRGYRPDVYLVNQARGILPGRYGGVDDLIGVMGLHDLKWHRSDTEGATAGPDGLIPADAVVLIKVNAQWAQRGGTNTDVLRGVIRRIVEHPDGFAGEIIVADNGQGSGSLTRTENNAENPAQSPTVVVNDFRAEGWTISTRLWDGMRTTSVSEYSAGDDRDGYVVNPALDPQTQVRVSYPKFRTTFGTYVSYKNGIWNPAAQSYDHDRLVVINMPVLKTHSIYAVTSTVKNHMGVVTGSLSTDAHYGVARGGLGSVLAEVRLPNLTILDCIWILARPGQGPSASYTAVSRRDQLVASVDPIAMDIWAAKFIMMPQIIANGYAPSSYQNTQDPDNLASVYRRYLDASMNELLAADIPTTNDYNAVNLHVFCPGDVDGDNGVDLEDLTILLAHFGTPGGAQPSDGDLDADGDVDLQDLAILLASFGAACS